MCWGPFAAGTAALRHGADALEVVVLDDVVPAAVLVAEPAAGLLVDELELLPHPAIVKMRTRIGNALRTGASKAQPDRGVGPGRVA
jgi:hypothetical protein